MRLGNFIESLYRMKKHYFKKGTLKRTLYWAGRLFRPFSTRVYVIGCPEYSNLGDNAILIAELVFLKKCGFTEKQIVCITEHEFLQDHVLIRRWINKGSLIFGNGGGNMGNIYRSEEQIRRLILEDFPRNAIVIFPQTIDYRGVNKDRDEHESIAFYNGRKNLTLFAREKQSQEIMKQLYPDTEVFLTPDIVLSATMRDFGANSGEREGALFCIRSDAEKTVDASCWENLKMFFRSQGLKCTDTDMHSAQTITAENRIECIRKKMHEFCSSQIVITDRLHGMVFAALTGTPCIAFSNNNHKVVGTYEWIQYLPYIKYVNSVQEAVTLIPDLLQIKNCSYNNEPLMPFFDIIKRVIISKGEKTT